MKFASVTLALLGAATLVSGHPVKGRCRPSKGGANKPSYPIATPGTGYEPSQPITTLTPGSGEGANPGYPAIPHPGSGTGAEPSYPIPTPTPGTGGNDNLPGYPSVPAPGNGNGGNPSYPTPGKEGKPYPTPGNGTVGHPSYPTPGNGTQPSYPTFPLPGNGTKPGNGTTKRNTMTILATNDIHTRLDQFNKGGTDCRQKDIDSNTCYGGAARIQYLVSKFRSERDDVVLLDAGDQFQGTLFFNVYGASASAEIMNQLMYTAMCIGNHEFDKGVEYAGTFFKNLTFPVISSNIDLQTAPKLAEAGVKPYIVLKEYGVGIIGYITNTTSQITTGAKGIVFRNPVPVVQKYVDELQSQGIKRIICLSHNGYAQDKYLAENVRGLNLIVGGHSHSLLLNNQTVPGVEGPYPTEVTNPDNKTTYIVQSHRYGDYLGHVSLTWNNADELVNFTGESILLDQTIPIDNSTAAKVAEWRKGFAALTEQVVGQASADLPNAGCGAGECAIGNLIADSMLDNRQAEGGQIAFVNSGSIRAALEKGNISVADVLTILPFGNSMMQFPYTGAQIMEVLERQAAGKSKAGVPLTSISQWAGLKFSYDATAPEFSRVKSVVIVDAQGKEEPLDLNKTYQAVTNDFVAGGGDGIMPPVSAAPGDLQSDVFITYISKLKTVSPKLEGRIRKI
ncbi:hypothetical protein SpCBS45565_g07774 [Spizellomyces sp. 'palustris']|nr:hypothetical protein SpCBS45565_g07774 [Spizellomyces sp. 'palustris']